MSDRSIVGSGCLRDLPALLEARRAERIFLVTGNDSYELSGAMAALEPVLSGRCVQRLCGFEANPKLADVEGGIERYIRFQSDLVIGVGGGSVLDTAKMIQFFGAHGVSPASWFEGVRPKMSDPQGIIAIPTTAGSGAEATSFAVIYIDGVKHSVDHPALLPEVALVDPTLMRSLPAQITASTGMDALSQAIESYWSIRSTDDSTALAQRAIECIVPNLRDAVRHPTDEVRLAMAVGANLAGRAIAITRTTACHAISYPLTSQFGVPHGHAVALTVPSMIEHIAGVGESDVLDTRGAAFVSRRLDGICALLGEDDAAGARGSVEGLMRDIGLEARLGALGVKSVADIDRIVAGALGSDRAGNTPRCLHPAELRRMLQALQ